MMEFQLYIIRNICWILEKDEEGLAKTGVKGTLEKRGVVLMIFMTEVKICKWS